LSLFVLTENTATFQDCQIHDPSIVT